MSFAEKNSQEKTALDASNDSIPVYRCIVTITQTTESELLRTCNAQTTEWKTLESNVSGIGHTVQEAVDNAVIMSKTANVYNA